MSQNSLGASSSKRLRISDSQHKNFLLREDRGGFDNENKYLKTKESNDLKISKDTIQKKDFIGLVHEFLHI